MISSKYDTVFVIEYFDKVTEEFVRYEVIPHCTILDIKLLLEEVFSRKEPIGFFESGQEFIIGGYEITPIIKEKIHTKFGLAVDTEHYDCFLSQEYKCAVYPIPTPIT
jgi:hypothetical protein